MHVGVFNDNSCLEPAFHTWLALVSSLFILKSCLVENNGLAKSWREQVTFQ
jgi:hypothetical protein